MIGTWGKGLSLECPAPLSKYIKGGLTSLKGVVRLGLCRMMVELYTDSRIKWLKDLVDPVSKCIEKALAQPAVVNNLTEAISLSLLLLNASSSFNNKDNVISIPEQSYTQSNKVAGFVDDKFLSSCLPWALHHLASLVRHFLNSNFPGSVNVNPKTFSLVVSCLPCADHQVRSSDLWGNLNAILC